VLAQAFRRQAARPKTLPRDDDGADCPFGKARCKR
jgi:hypothetical protein